MSGLRHSFGFLTLLTALALLPAWSQQGHTPSRERVDPTLRRRTEIDGNNVPTTTQRAASAKVAVRDRETIILGGFMSKQSTKTKSGVPFLKDIPGLGALFRSTGNDGQQVELMVLIRPTVLPTPEAAALEAADQRDKMPGIKRAELETREEERQREKAVEKEMRKKLGLKSGG